MKYREKQMFAQRIKELRTSLGLTQQQMADMVGLRKTAISNYESGYSTPNLEYLRIFMREFNLPASYFVPDEPLPVVKNKFTQLMYGSAIHYYNPDNIPGLLADDPSRIDSTLTLPAQLHTSRVKHISTMAEDNSMNLAGIKKGTCVVINTENKTPLPNQIFAAIYDEELIIRRYIEDEDKRYMVAESTRIPSGLSRKELPTENFAILGIVDTIVVKL